MIKLLLGGKTPTFSAEESKLRELLTEFDNDLEKNTEGKYYEGL
jgi:hypothetical protein